MPIELGAEARSASDPSRKPNQTRVDIIVTAREVLARDSAAAGATRAPAARTLPAVADSATAAYRTGRLSAAPDSVTASSEQRADELHRTARPGSGAAARSESATAPRPGSNAITGPKRDQADQPELRRRVRQLVGVPGDRRAEQASSRCLRGSGSPRTSGTAPRGGPRSADRLGSAPSSTAAIAAYRSRSRAAMLPR